MSDSLFKIEPKGFPDLGAMMFATIIALEKLGGSGTLHEIDEQVIEDQKITEEEQNYPMPGDERRPKVNYYLAWSRTYLKKGGLIENSGRGVWALTEEGARIKSVEQTKDVYRDVQSALNTTRLNKKETTRLNEEKEPENIDFEPSDNWKDQLLKCLLEMEPSAFERLSQRLLREAGFTKVEVRGKIGDGGVDGLGILRVNLVSFQVYFQCKRWKGSVGSKEIRDFRGALQGRADKGLFITTGTFTSQASEEATRDGAIAIDLIDGDALCSLLKEYHLGVSTEMIERVDINENWFAEI